VGCLVLLAIIVPLVLFLSKDGAPTAINPSPTSTPQSIKPMILHSQDFSYWAWEPKPTPQTKYWPQVVPPEAITSNFVLSGWAGDLDVISTDEKWSTDFHSEPTCLKFVYSPNDQQGEGWAGRLWVDASYPKYSSGVSLADVEKLTFWARGDKGGERVEFRVGGAAISDPQPSFTTHVVTLSEKWQSFTIDFTDRSNLDYVFCGFSWLTTQELNPNGCTFYLDYIQFE
jgi:hypothetical protein